eukprot:15725-Heterococcus_DN1.PRE.9
MQQVPKATLRSRYKLSSSTQRIHQEQDSRTLQDKTMIKTPARCVKCYYFSHNCISATSVAYSTIAGCT